MSDFLFITAGGLAVLTGIIGSILPVLPGPVAAFAGMLLLQFSSAHPFSTAVLVTFGSLTVASAALDYIIPVYGVKKFEGSRYGVWGSMAGLLLGIFILFPAGLILGPAIGAFAGEIVGGKSPVKAIKPALGSLAGFLAGTGLRLAISIIMGWFFIEAAYRMITS
jgi:hypothetical protein